MIPYEIGIAHYRELARGQILGETHGLVKLLVSPDDRSCSACTRSARAPPRSCTSARP